MTYLNTINPAAPVQVEISFPFYCKSKSGNYHYKIISESKAIAVFKTECNPMVQVFRADTALDGGFTPITETTFEDALQFTLNQILN